MSSIARFLVSNGVVSHNSDVPSVSLLLENHPGAYTTTRTHNNVSCILFWERHMQRLANSARILFQSKPEFLFGPTWSAHSSFPDTTESFAWEPLIQSLVKDSMSKFEASVVKYREVGHEFAITVLVGGNKENVNTSVYLDEGNISRLLDVHVHVGSYIPTAFGIKGHGAYLAMLGRPRVVAAGKYSDWVRLRKPLEQLSPPSVTELLLSNDGDHILEGSKTNFFVVSLSVDRKHTHDDERRYSSFEVQTAPVGDGVLPGVIRQLVIEVCLSKGIAVKEAAPSWSKRESWEEAFITNSLRLVQHVDRIEVPEDWESRDSKDIVWQEKQFKDGPGMITALIQQEIMERATCEGKYRDCIFFFTELEVSICIHESEHTPPLQAAHQPQQVPDKYCEIETICCSDHTNQGNFCIFCRQRSTMPQKNE